MSAFERAALAQLLGAELAMLRGFTLCLQLEQEFLVAGEIDRLGPVLAEKGRLAQDLAATAERRNAALAAAGLPNDRAGVEAWLADGKSMGAGKLAAAAHAAVFSDWQAILALAARARALNETSGKLIGKAMQDNNRALALLAAADCALLYGPDGREQARAGRRQVSMA